MAPSHHTVSIANMVFSAMALVQKVLSAFDANSARPILTAAMTTSATIDRTNIAASAVARPAGRTNSAATASSKASQATTALRP